VAKACGRARFGIAWGYGYYFDKPGAGVTKLFFKDLIAIRIGYSSEFFVIRPVYLNLYQVLDIRAMRVMARVAFSFRKSRTLPCRAIIRSNSPPIFSRPGSAI
jgi:hypothetical protein